MGKRHKVVVLGNARVGKTSLIHRLATGTFKDTCIPTFGVDWFYKDIVVPDENDTISLHIWDTGGVEHYSSLQPLYLRDASVILLCFDLADRESFENLAYWKHLACRDRSDGLVYLVGNKSDQVERRIILQSDAERLSVLLSCKAYFEVSAADGSNVESLFGKIAKDLRAQAATALSSSQGEPPTVDLNVSSLTTGQPYSKCYC